MVLVPLKHFETLFKSSDKCPICLIQRCALIFWMFEFVYSILSRKYLSKCEKSRQSSFNLSKFGHKKNILKQKYFRKKYINKKVAVKKIRL